MDTLTDAERADALAADLAVEQQPALAEPSTRTRTSLSAAAATARSPARRITLSRTEPEEVQDKDEAMVEENGDEEEELQQQETLLSEEAIAAQEEMAELAKDNPRLQQMNIALEKFLGLVDVATEQDKFLAAIPHVPSNDLQRLSRTLVGQLKSFVLTQHVQLVQGFEIDARLAELSEMVEEANARIAKGLQPDSEELKDAWRPHLTAAQVVLARQIPEQRDEIERLEAQLRELEEDNIQQEIQLKAVKADREAQVSKTRSALSNLDKTVKAMDFDEAMEKRIRETMDALLIEVGPRG
ncbi:hypothetical protein A4X09_0g1912 [Tilletia walkeri]|uniref:Uncharacterized protein n=1 Tax=Tilletia walkeri TaxID=117179 RepID=A0A8X7NAS2_9BASI|nr:hypothetical protein A4X09_0g1912 [Tilletia walkeri]